MDIQSQIDDLFAPKPEVVEESFPEVVKEEKKRKEYVRVKIDDDIFGDLTGGDLQDLTEALEDVQEAIDVKKADMGEVITDFRNSDAPQFKGKSDKKKQQMAIAAKLNAESYEERLMNTVVSQITKNAKNENLQLKEVPELNEERIKNLETQLLQVRQLFHEATMVSGIGQGGDGQTPGSGEVKLSRMDDVSTDGLEVGDTLVWGGVNGWVPGTSGVDASDVVSSILPGVGIDVAGTIPPGKGDVTIALDASIGDLNDVNVNSASEGQAIVYQAGGWVAAGVTTNQVDLTNPQGNPFNIQYPRYTTVSPFNVYTTQEDANQLFGALIEDLDDRVGVIENATKPGTYLGQEDVTDPNNEPNTGELNQGDYFIHDGPTGSLWGTGDQVENGDSVIWNGTTWEIISTTTTLSQLGDVVISGATTGQMLVYNDTNSRWYNETVDIPNVFIDTVMPAGQGEKDGDFWLKSDTNILHMYNSIWTVVGGGASSSIGPNPPADPQAGALWVDTDDYNLYTWDGQQWIDLTGGAGGDAAYVTLGDLNDTLDTVNFNINEVQNNLNVGILALDQTHLRITPQTPLLGTLTTESSLTFRDTNNPGSGEHQINVTEGNALKIRASDVGGAQRTFIDIKNADQNGGDGTDDGYRMKLYHVADPTGPQHAATKAYVDSQVSDGIPVGSIMIWMNSDAPPGWFKLQGGSFNINDYPLLHTYLGNTGDYTSGKLPDWSGYFPGEWGGSNGTGQLNTKQGYRTGQPSGGPPKSSHQFNDGHQDTANKAGGTHFADVPTRKVEINQGWDDVTRPNTILVHYIIKHD